MRKLLPGDLNERVKGAHEAYTAALRRYKLAVGALEERTLHQRFYCPYQPEGSGLQADRAGSCVSCGLSVMGHASAIQAQAVVVKNRTDELCRSSLVLRDVMLEARNTITEMDLYTEFQSPATAASMHGDECLLDDECRPGRDL